MLRKIVLVVFITIFIVLNGFCYIKGKSFELVKTKEYIESLFNKHYTCKDCDEAHKLFIKSKTKFIKFSTTSSYYQDRNLVLVNFSEDLPAFFDKLCKKLNNTKDVCVLVWCVEPIIRFDGNDYYGESTGYIVLEPSSMFVFIKKENLFD